MGAPYPIRDHLCVPLRAAPTGDAEKEIAGGRVVPLDRIADTCYKDSDEQTQTDHDGRAEDRHRAKRQDPLPDCAGYGDSANVSVSIHARRNLPSA